MAQVVAALDLPAAVAEGVIARIEISSALETRLAQRRRARDAAAFEPPPQSPARCRATSASPTPWPSVSGIVCGWAPPCAPSTTTRRPSACRPTPGEIDARRVVIALPLPVLRELPCTPALPAPKLAALDRVALGHAAKLHIPLAGAAAASAVDDLARPLLVLDRDRGRRPCGAGPELLRRLPGRAGPARRRRRARDLARARPAPPPRSPDRNGRSRADHLERRPVGARRLQHRRARDPGR